MNVSGMLQLLLNFFKRIEPMSHPFEQVAKRFIKPSDRSTQAVVGAVFLQVETIAAD
jgi:hypothetical protein